MAAESVSRRGKVDPVVEEPKLYELIHGAVDAKVRERYCKLSRSLLHFQPKYLTCTGGSALQERTAAASHPDARPVRCAIASCCAESVCSLVKRKTGLCPPRHAGC